MNSSSENLSDAPANTNDGKPHSFELESAAQKADALVKEIAARHGDLTPAFDALETAIPEFEATGYPLESLIPAGQEAGLGFNSKKARSGKGFWEIYSKAVRDTLCDKKSKLRHLVSGGLTSSTGAVITAIMSTLALPVAAITIVVPISAILVTLGVDAYCEYTEPEESKQKR